jgi:hypothetical protein
MGRITLKVLPGNFASGPPFEVFKGWRPGLVRIYATRPEGADVAAAPLPTRGGMRIVVYNRSAETVEVDLEDNV